MASNQERDDAWLAEFRKRYQDGTIPLEELERMPPVLRAVVEEYQAEQIGKRTPNPER